MLYIGYESDIESNKMRTARMAGCSAKVVVGGSIYADMAIRCVQFPSGGDSVRGLGFSCVLTGSGVNQATQAAVLGCQVSLIGKVGKDIFGQMAKDNLSEVGVDCDSIFCAEAKNTGTSLSFVNNSGENRTCVSSGANRALLGSEVSVGGVENLISSADVCVVNADLLPEVVSTIIRTAKLSRTKVILDPQLSSEQFEQSRDELPIDYYSADVLVTNLSEAAELSHSATGNIHAAKVMGSDLLARGLGCVIVKLGRRGAVVVDKNGADHISSFDVNFVDHTACGDAFNGALAACCGVGDEIRKAVKFASAAGALACSKFGTQEALPQKAEILELLQELP